MKKKHGMQMGGSGFGLRHGSTADGDMSAPSSTDVSHEYRGHGIGKRLASMHEEALSKASPARVAQHSSRMEKGRARHVTKGSWGDNNSTRNATAARTAHAAKRGQHVAKGSSSGKSNWAAWNAAHKKA